MNIICVWPSGEWCWKENLEEHLMPPCAMSDDFQTFDVGDSDNNQIEDFVVLVNEGEVA